MVLLDEDAQTLRALRAVRAMMEIPPVGPHATVADLVRVIWEDLAKAFDCAVPQVVALSRLEGQAIAALTSGSSPAPLAEVQGATAPVLAEAGQRLAG